MAFVCQAIMSVGFLLHNHRKEIKAHIFLSIDRYIKKSSNAHDDKRFFRLLTRVVITNDMSER
jgi:hypothetical protein